MSIFRSGPLQKRHSLPIYSRWRRRQKQWKSRSFFELDRYISFKVSQINRIFILAFQHTLRPVWTMVNDINRMITQPLFSQDSVQEHGMADLMAEMMGAAFDIGDPELIHRRNIQRREMLDMMDGVYSDYDDFSPADSLDMYIHQQHQIMMPHNLERAQQNPPEQPNNDPARVSSNGQSNFPNLIFYLWNFRT